MTHRGPVVIAPYTPEWPAMFEAERARLLALFAGADVQIEHVGSTSVPGLGAKPIVDVMLGAQALAVVEAKIGALELAGYEYVPKYETALPLRRYFVKPTTRPRTFHLHAVTTGSAFWVDHLAFRDALRRDRELARRYFDLKTELAQQCSDDRERYQESKTPFIRSVLASLQAATL